MSGTYSMSIRAIDDLGLSSSTIDVYFDVINDSTTTVVNSPPSISNIRFTANPINITNQQRTLTVYFSVSDSDGVDSWWCSFEGSGEFGGGTGPETNLTVDDANCSVTLNPEEIVSGTYSMSIRAIDDLGLSSSTIDVYFDVINDSTTTTTLP